VNARRIAQVFADLAGQSFRLVPHRKRFDVARRVALALAPFYRRSPLYARRPSLLDGAREECMRMVLRTMTRTGVPFVPDFGVRGGELVPPGPVLVASGHFLLNIMMSRWFEERGHPFTVVVGGPREPMFIAGTRVAVDLVQAGPDVLLRVRGRLAQGRTVFVNLEQLLPHEGWTTVDTAAGRHYVSSSVLRFAERTRTALIFAAVHFDENRRVTLTFARPSAGDAATMMADYCAFLAAEAAKVHTRPG